VIQTSGEDGDWTAPYRTPASREAVMAAHGERFDLLLGRRGVGSARELDRLCDSDDACRWLSGGVGVNHHTLGDFRVMRSSRWTPPR
jgi:hypothetical protein